MKKEKKKKGFKHTLATTVAKRSDSEATQERKRQSFELVLMEAGNRMKQKEARELAIELIEMYPVLDKRGALVFATKSVYVYGHKVIEQCILSYVKYATNNGYRLVPTKMFFEKVFEEHLPVAKKKSEYDLLFKDNFRENIKIKCATGEEVTGYNNYQNTKHWKFLRMRLLRGAACSKCGSKDTLQLHHNTYKRLGRELDSDLEPLCKECHLKIHNRLIYNKAINNRLDN